MTGRNFDPPDLRAVLDVQGHHIGVVNEQLIAGQQWRGAVAVRSRGVLDELDPLAVALQIVASDQAIAESYKDLTAIRNWRRAGEPTDRILLGRAELAG